MRGGQKLASAKTEEDRLIPARAGRTSTLGTSHPRPRAHPRSCGADRCESGLDEAPWGSSPLVRGGLAGDSVPGRLRGLIPARAGRTLAHDDTHRQNGAHPRSCGADVDEVDEVVVLQGSSPLVRGGRMQGRVHQRRRGLIPARAGRTGLTNCPLRFGTAHPRSCGADYQVQPGDTLMSGSSPLVRGGLRFLLAPITCLGLIPARAGRTVIAPLSVGSTSAHPRSCGADRQRVCVDGYSPGSSPLVRGGLSRFRRLSGWHGLIPARAGRTRNLRGRRHLLRAHPRSCGADMRPLRGETWSSGSSPLVRGGRGTTDRHRCPDGLIPARAGRTRVRTVQGCHDEAHPRSCGADDAYVLTTMREMGSSPLVRGGRVLYLHLVPAKGLIPARAGRTPTDIVGSLLK